MDFVKAVFEYLFDNECDKAILQFNRYINLSAKTEESYEDIQTYDGRKTRFYKVSGENAFTVWVYSKK